MARMARKTNEKGFSLVELLIVVAIIGVLSTIGVPTFRRMVTKAKQSEAKTALSGLFTVESAFFTEYNTYGNRLNRIGYELEGNQRRYSVGFPTAACASQAIAPTAANAPSLNTAFPQYFDAAAPNGRLLDTAYLRNDVPGTVTEACAAGTFPAAGTTFVATATGNIAPGVAADAAVVAGAGSQDVWTMNETRTLTNTVNGVN